MVSHDPHRTVPELADELVELLFAADPLSPAVLGIDRAREGLPDLSAEAGRRHRADLVALAERAAAAHPASLAPRDRVTREVVLRQAQSQIDQIDSRLVEFTVTDLFISPAVELLLVLPMIGVTEPDEARAHLGRLEAIPTHLEQALSRHRAGIAAGLLPVEHLVRAAISHIDRYLTDPDADPLLRQEAPDEEFESARRGLLATVVRPAYAAYRAALETEVLPHGRPADRPGLRWLPGGDAMYAALARLHTTTDRTPDELHQTGLDIIARLRDEYADIGERVFGTRDLPEIFRRMRTDPELRWKDGDELLDAARAAIARAQDAAPRWFGTIPPQPCVVEAVPAGEAPGGPPAYYMPPSTDGAQPGIYFANTYEVTERFRHSSEAVAFHEAVPGHHFQLSLALELSELPLLRRIGGFTAYAEGWGLYAERLADEMGLYSGDIARLGMLSLDSMRAGRLVADTGLHAKGWSRQQTVDYLVEHTPMAQVEIESEVDRYIGWPGQALAYMVGRLEIERIRAAAAAALGERFDLKAFHDLVLGGGALPLSVLDDVVTEWTKSRGTDG